LTEDILESQRLSSAPLGKLNSYCVLSLLIDVKG